jgi:hypothetical protein
VAAVLGVGGAASAHELTCEKRVNGMPVAAVDTYPATVNFTFRVNNVHPNATSVATSIEDRLLAGYGFSWPGSTPLALDVGQSAEASFSLVVASYEACLTFAESDGAQDAYFDNDLRVTWDLGETQCSARLQCLPPSNECPGCQPLRPEPTRDEGFFKTHEQALRTCLASGPVDLGLLGRVTTAEQALGLLWGSPELYADGKKRSTADAARFDVGRQLLVATCNGRVFGSQPKEEGLLDRARGMLSGLDCQGMGEARKALSAFNSAGAREPVAVDAGPATPVRARATASDFTRPSGFGCAGSR